MNLRSKLEQFAIDGDYEALGITQFCQGYNKYIWVEIEEEKGIVFYVCCELTNKYVINKYFFSSLSDCLLKFIDLMFDHNTIAELKQIYPHYV